MSERRDYYEVLGVERTVEAAELKRAYSKLAMELHPDRNPGDKVAEAKFKEASEAYQVLSDPQKRAHYDRFGHDGPSLGAGGGFHDVGDIFSAFSDIFGDIFGGRMGGGRAPARARWRRQRPARRSRRRSRRRPLRSPGPARIRAAAPYTARRSRPRSPRSPSGSGGPAAGQTAAP